MFHLWNTVSCTLFLWVYFLFGVGTFLSLQRRLKCADNLCSHSVQAHTAPQLLFHCGWGPVGLRGTTRTKAITAMLHKFGQHDDTVWAARALPDQALPFLPQLHEDIAENVTINSMFKLWVLIGYFFFCFKVDLYNGCSVFAHVLSYTLVGKYHFFQTNLKPKRNLLVDFSLQSTWLLECYELCYYELLIENFGGKNQPILFRKPRSIFKSLKTEHVCIFLRRHT